jgi:hypothetical protein
MSTPHSRDAVSPAPLEERSTDVLATAEVVGVVEVVGIDVSRSPIATPVDDEPSDSVKLGFASKRPLHPLKQSTAIPHLHMARCYHGASTRDGARNL